MKRLLEKRIAILLLILSMALALCGCERQINKQTKEDIIQTVDNAIQEEIAKIRSGESTFSKYLDIDEVSYEIIDVVPAAETYTVDYLVTIEYRATTTRKLDRTEKSLACYDMEDLFTSCTYGNSKVGILGTDYSGSRYHIYHHISSWVNGEQIHRMDKPEYPKWDIDYYMWYIVFGEFAVLIAIGVGLFLLGRDTSKHRAAKWYSISVLIIGIIVFPYACFCLKGTACGLVAMFGMLSLVMGFLGCRLVGAFGDGDAPRPSRADVILNSQLQAISRMPDGSIKADMLHTASVDYMNNIQKDYRQKETTKAMVKGAVIGGIIGGDAGAVVGAAIAKNKADNK